MALYAFDGTWNSKKDNEDEHQHNTNVVKFHAAYQKNTGKEEVYVPGVGTRFKWLGGGIWGGVFGLGELPRLHEAYERLCVRWDKNEDDNARIIDIVGFSRGAATALDFYHLVQERGIRKPGTETVVEAQPRIRFLGLWDIVPSFGLANLGNQALNFFHYITTPNKNIDYCCHAMALDERRPSFLNIRLSGAYEVWFRGVHSDIGGGNGNTGLSDIALRWMMLKAQAAKLPILDADIPAATSLPVLTPPQPNPNPPLPIKVRLIGAADRQHYTVGPMGQWAMAPGTCLSETAADESKVVKVGAGLEILSQTQRRDVVQMWETAADEAKQLETDIEPARDVLFALFTARLPLVNDTTRPQAGAAIRRLVTVANSCARKAGFHALEPVFINQALSQLPNVFPLTD